VICSEAPPCPAGGRRALVTDRPVGIADRVRRVREGLASAAVNGQAMRLDVATGEQLWRRGVPKGPSPIAHHADKVWVGGGRGLLGFAAAAGTQTAEVDLPGRATALAAEAWASAPGQGCRDQACNASTAARSSASAAVLSSR
jgi:hypothetical protein